VFVLKQIYLRLVWLALLVSASGLLHAAPIEVCNLYFANGVVLSGVPEAKTIAQITTGLSDRKDVGAGMLFSWEKPEPRVFWMHNTLVPLTIGFFDETGLLFALEEMAAETENFHYSGLPALHALELAQGQFEMRGLGVGQRLVGRDCKPAH
jgi:uncharacterized protein